jgi:hypothetical protein
MFDKFNDPFTDLNNGEKKEIEQDFLKLKKNEFELNNSFFSDSFKLFNNSDEKINDGPFLNNESIESENLQYYKLNDINSKSIEFNIPEVSIPSISEQSGNPNGLSDESNLLMSPKNISIESNKDEPPKIAKINEFVNLKQTKIDENKKTNDLFKSKNNLEIIEEARKSIKKKSSENKLQITKNIGLNKKKTISRFAQELIEESRKNKIRPTKKIETKKIKNVNKINELDLKKKEKNSKKKTEDHCYQNFNILDEKTLNKENGSPSHKRIISIASDLTDCS